MIEKYNVPHYWEKLIHENKTIRGHMFMDEMPEEKSIYFHTLIFTKKNGMNNVWGYCPNLKAFLGYIQYSFLQEAFYKWIYGKEKTVTRVPFKSVTTIINDGEKKKIISKDVAAKMREDYAKLNKLWTVPKENIEKELNKFIREFNKSWIGDEKEFLYIKFFKNPKELGDFVVSSSALVGAEKELEQKLGLTIDEWTNIYLNAEHDKENGESFRRILRKKLTEVY